MELLDKFGIGILIPVILFALVGVLAQWSLYDKCGLPGIDCIIPVKNVISFLKIVGRPSTHALYVIFPPLFIVAAIFLVDGVLQYALAAVLFIPWALIMMRIYIELCQSFGHYKTSDYVLCLLLNGFYVLHLGLSYGEKYKGPVYGKEKTSKASRLEGQLV